MSFPKIDKAIEENKKPTIAAHSGNLMLTSSLGRVKIASSSGALTKAGRYYYREKPDEERPATQGFEPSRPLIRRGEKEFIKMRDGSERLARKWNPATSDFTYTRLGRSYFSGTRESFVIHIPVLIRGQNKKTGRAYTREAWLPHQALDNIGDLKVPVALSEAEKHARLKQMVLNKIDAQKIIELSDEVYEYKQDGEWRISKLTTREAEDASLVTEAVLDRPLQAARPFSYSHFQNAWAIDESAYDETEGQCVCHQLSVQLQIDEAVVREKMEEIAWELYESSTHAANWKGCTAAMVLRFCKFT